MNFGKIRDCDIANGDGVRVTLFVSGCTNHCKGCFQPETWDFCYGQPFTDETEDMLISLLNRPFIRGLTVLGGEPLEPRNQPAVLHLLKRVRAELPDKNIWCFSGFTLEELLDPDSYCHTECTEELLGLVDVLVDGRFVESRKNITLRFRGSENQRVLNLRKTLQNNRIEYLYEEDI